MYSNIVYDVKYEFELVKTMLLLPFVKQGMPFAMPKPQYFIYKIDKEVNMLKG